MLYYSFNYATGRPMTQDADEQHAALFRAVRMDDAAALQKILEESPDAASWHEKPADKLTPLHVAAHHGSTQAIRILYKHNAELDAQDKDGWTPLMYAAAFGVHQAVVTLIECGANPHIEDNNGDTPLTKAVKRFRSDLTPIDYSSLTALVTAGVDPARKASGGDSAFSLAKSFNSNSAVMALIHADRLRIDHADLAAGKEPAIRVMTPPTIKKRNRPGHNTAGLS